jgi:hypothetical protein
MGKGYWQQFLVRIDDEKLDPMPSYYKLDYSSLYYGLNEIGMLVTNQIKLTDY